MKIRFFCDSGANIHSCNKGQWLDVEHDLGFTSEDWALFSEEDKYKLAEEWAWNEGLEIYFEEKG